MATTKKESTKVAATALKDRRGPGEVLRGLTAMAWWRKVGTAEARRIAEKAGTTYEHFKHLAHGRRAPSVRLAVALQKASRSGMTAGALLGIEPRRRSARKDDSRGAAA